MFKELRDDMYKTMAKLIYLAGMVGDSNNSFEESNLFFQAGNFKDIVDALETRKFNRNSDIKSLGQRILFLEKTVKKNSAVSKDSFVRNMVKIQKIF